MQKILNKLTTYYQLGISNLVYVLLYRLAVKFNFFVSKLPIKFLNENNNDIQFFKIDTNHDKINIEEITKLKAFGWLDISTDKPPNWLSSVTNGKQVKNNQIHWSQLSDFDLNVGDIKTVWELSRFNWALLFTLKYKKTSDTVHLDMLNNWLSNWCYYNPANQGVNWKCGQEASIRVMHLATCCYLLHQSKEITTPMANLLYQHLLRISPTIHYAMAQDNNHGTSEAAALYIGSLLLLNHTDFKQSVKVNKWKKTGQYWLENRAQELINNDGAFSQNSVNYHRLMLDTLSLVEFFRQQFEQNKFTNNYYHQVKKACYWLKMMICPSTGEAALVGLNDGAQLVPITSCDYLDFRPSVQWAFNLFQGYSPYSKNHSYHQLTLLLPTKNITSSETASVEHRLESSYHQLLNNESRCYIRTPNLKFRPACCDALHIDFWHNNTNILVSTGSYSYNCEAKYQEYFPSVRSHNTVQFDSNEQMPKLSRFLYSNWIKALVYQISPTQLAASYNNVYNHSHERKITLTPQSLEVIDTISGFNNSATIRWHLPNMSWQLNHNRLTAEQYTIEVNSRETIKNIALVDGLQSRYYLKKAIIPVLEITLTQASTISTKISW